MIDAALHNFGLAYNNAFCYIKKTNVASLRASSKCGFRILGDAEIRGRLRKLHLVNDGMGAFYIVRYMKGEDVVNQ